MPDPRNVGDVPNLKELNDSEVTRHKLIWEKKYWVWMNPDWYVSLLVARHLSVYSFFPRL
jgi:hypothetical protein